LSLKGKAKGKKIAFPLLLGCFLVDLKREIVKIIRV
jgi:hypothetical protein